LSESVTEAVRRLALSAGRSAQRESVKLPQALIPYIRLAHFGVRRNWQTGPERSFDYCLLHVQEGHVRLCVEGVVHDLPRGCFGLVQPNDLVVLEGVGDTVTPYLQFDVFYHPERELQRPGPGLRDLSAFAELVQPRLNDLPGVDIPPVLRPRDPAGLASTMLRAIGAWLQGDAVNLLEAHSLTGALVAAIMRDHAPTLGTRPAAAQPLAWVPAYMAVHLAEQLTVREMARRAGLSPSRFARVFRERYGNSPHRFLLALRVRMAQDLLRETELSHERIAEHCGFADTFHFSKVFKRRTGMPPREYRQLQRARAAVLETN
jgi:AraC-like DNA-binding protein